ncbi:MAG TPA: M67 family metallopeptidase [Longimicrobiales bacterium]
MRGTVLEPGAAVGRPADRTPADGGRGGAALLPPAGGIACPPTLLERVRAHAAEAYPLEACGLLIGREDTAEFRLTRVLPCPNVAAQEERHRRFAIEPRAVLNVRRALRGTGEAIIGFFHSHPDAEATPSATDMEFIRLWPHTAWMIVPVREGRALAPRSWWLVDGESRARELVVREAAARAVVCPE